MAGRTSSARLIPGWTGLLLPGRSGLAAVHGVAAVPASHLRVRSGQLAPRLPEPTGRTGLPGPVVTRRLPDPVAPAPKAARTRMGESADVLEEP
jgi:hypothetical protein